MIRELTAVSRWSPSQAKRSKRYRAPIVDRRGAGSIAYIDALPTRLQPARDRVPISFSARNEKRLPVRFVEASP